MQEKGAVLDGGVRGVAAVWSPWLKKKHRISENLFHITDWLPTLYTAAGNYTKKNWIDSLLINIVCIQFDKTPQRNKRYKNNGDARVWNDELKIWTSIENL